MTKEDELSNPESCLNRAHDCELVFVLLARDEAAPVIVTEWCRLRVLLGKNKWEDPQIMEALALAGKMAEQFAARKAALESAVS